MENQKKTRGILLRRFDLNEADQILVILTEDYGKVSLVAKGAKRLKSKFCGRLEPFYHLSLNYFQGKELGHLNEAEILDAFSSHESDLKVKSLLFYIAEMTAKLVVEDGGCNDIYHLLKECLFQLKDEKCEVLLPAYMVKLLTLLGFMAPWDVCSQSHTKINLDHTHYFSVRNASVVQRGFADSSDIRLTPAIIKWINYMQKEDFETLKRVIPSTGEKKEVFLILKLTLENLLNHPFRSEVFLQAVNQF